jgi:hypothetical protein
LANFDGCFVAIRHEMDWDYGHYGLVSLELRLR